MTLILLLACATTTPQADDTASHIASDTASHTTSDYGSDPSLCSSPLPARRTPDATRAATGLALLMGADLSEPLIPRMALDYLWLVWGSGMPADDAAFQAALQDRYGLLPDPNGGPYALGLPAIDSTWASLSCLACHADGVAGQVVVGAGSSRFDLQGFYDDLMALAALGTTYGFPEVQLPWAIEDRTAAAGATDAFGLGMELSLAYGPDLDIATHYGFQQSAPWWGNRFKGRVYRDGQGSAEGHRTMAAMLLAFGSSLSDIEARDDDLLDVWNAIQAIDAPAWPFDPPQPEAWAAGQTVYAQHCASCHGTVCDDDASFPDLITAQAGTDAARTDAFGDTEAAWINASWFGAEDPVQATAGYLAPPLVGIWAGAPYLHNGSVPDLTSLLDSSQRPQAWSRTGWQADDYDPDRMGWRFTVESTGTAADSIEHRRIVDTTRTGLSAAGHTYGDALTQTERTELLEFLRSL